MILSRATNAQKLREEDRGVRGDCRDHLRGSVRQATGGPGANAVFRFLPAAAGSDHKYRSALVGVASAEGKRGGVVTVGLHERLECLCKFKIQERDRVIGATHIDIPAALGADL